MTSAGQSWKKRRASSVLRAKQGVTPSSCKTADNAPDNLGSFATSKICDADRLITDSSFSLPDWTASIEHEFFQLANLIFALNYFSGQKRRVETGLPGNNAGNICSMA
jgi:hypothetical protein